MMTILTDPLFQPKVKIGNDLDEIFTNILVAERALGEHIEKDTVTATHVSERNTEAHKNYAELKERVEAIEAHVRKICVATVEDAARAYLYWTKTDPVAFGKAIARVAVE